MDAKNETVLENIFLVLEDSFTHTLPHSLRSITKRKQTFERKTIYLMSKEVKPSTLLKALLVWLTWKHSCLKEKNVKTKNMLPTLLPKRQPCMMTCNT